MILMSLAPNLQASIQPTVGPVFLFAPPPLPPQNDPSLHEIPSSEKIAGRVTFRGHVFLFGMAL